MGVLMGVSGKCSKSGQPETAYSGRFLAFSFRFDSRRLHHFFPVCFWFTVVRCDPRSAITQFF